MKQPLSTLCAALLGTALLHTTSVQAQDWNPSGVDKSELDTLWQTAYEEQTAGKYEGSYLFEEAITYAVSTLSFNGSSQKDVNTAVANLKAAMYREQEIDASPENFCQFFMVNPDFDGGITGYGEAGPLTGWTNSGAYQANISFLAGLCCENRRKDGSYLPNSELSQKIDALLPNGYYIMSVTAISNGAGTYFFAGNQAVAHPGKNTQLEMKVAVQVTDGTLTLGARTQNSTANLFRFDEFTLHYIGTAPDALTRWVAANVPGREDYVEYPQDYTQRELPRANKELKETYFSHLDEVRQTPRFTPATLNASMERLYALWADVKVSALEYDTLEAALDTARKYRAQLAVDNPAVRLTLDQAIEEVADCLANETAGDDGKEVPTLIAKLKDAQDNYIAIGYEPANDPTGLPFVDKGTEGQDSGLSLFPADGGIRIRSEKARTLL